jgi:tRNA nucleotidyltransferase (CCA-adding enzyme)
MASFRFENALDAQQLALLQSLGQAAEERGAKLWAVGGVVRDAIIGTPAHDIDLTSEAPADELGQVLVSALGGTAGPMTPFATVKLTIQGHHFDLATTRTETYPKPATLPIVTPSTLNEDLKRRDFAINAMAASLAPTEFGDVIDPYDGRADIDAHQVRVLHDCSFQDDPTRAFRAVRYAARLGFRIEVRTARWLRRDASLIQRLSGTRIRHEIERMLDEPRGATALLESLRHGLLGQIHPALGTSAIQRALRSAVRANLTGLELLAALMYPLSTSDVTTLADRLSLPKQHATLSRSTVRIREAESQLNGVPPSSVDIIVGNASTAALTSVAAVSPSLKVRASLRRYIRRSGLVVRHLDGDALARIGVPPGTMTGQALQALRKAELDNKIRTPQGAMLFVKRWLNPTPKDRKAEDRTAQER